MPYTSTARALCSCTSIFFKVILWLILLNWKKKNPEFSSRREMVTTLFFQALLIFSGLMLRALIQYDKQYSTVLGKCQNFRVGYCISERSMNYWNAYNSLSEMCLKIRHNNNKCTPTYINRSHYLAFKMLLLQ